MIAAWVERPPQALMYRTPRVLSRKWRWPGPSAATALGSMLTGV